MQIKLRRYRRADGIASSMECRAKRIADHLENVTPVGLDRCPQNLIMPWMGNQHFLRILLPKFGAVFNIRKQEGDRA